MKKIFLLTSFLWLLSVLAGCSSSSSSLDEPTISTFSAEPSNLNSGESGTLSWSVLGADSLILNPGNFDVTDKTSMVVSPFVTTKYSLIASNAQGKTQADTTITVKVVPLEVTVDPEITPTEPSIPDKNDKPHMIAVSQDRQGAKSEFIVGQLLIHPRSQQDLTDFLNRYEGTILSDDAIPEPPASLGISLTPEQRKASEYLVQINISKLDADNFVADAASVGMGGILVVSSEEGLLTLAGATNALAEGFSVSPNYVTYPTQTFPSALLKTQERPDGAGGFTDAFSTTRFQSTGSQSNVTQAWQFIAAHGIERRTRIAIIDQGFWLDTNGNPIGNDSDFPTIVGQYDFLGNDYIADGPGTIGCGAGNPCFWHGTGATSVAAGAINNLQGAAGTGGLVADVMLFKRGGTKASDKVALRTAIAWGADIISMSFGGDCDSVACRRFDRNNSPIADAVNAGSRTVFVAAAGNGEDPDGDGVSTGYDTGAPRFVHPCIEDYVICVGALNNDATTKIAYSNFGRVTIFAPTNIPVMAQPAGNDMNPNGPAQPRTFGGTSASAPFVAGVAAMMKAVNPALNSDDVSKILQETAHKGVAPVNFYIDAYAAVRKAAEGIDGVKDRFEPNDFVDATELTGTGPWTNLNLHNAEDKDYYRFANQQRSTIRIDVQYPDPLGTIPNLGLISDASCSNAIKTLDTPLAGGGRRFEYLSGAGKHTLSLGGGLINAYNLSIDISAASDLKADTYEINDDVSRAKRINGYKIVKNGFSTYYGGDPRVTVDANLHTATDVDYYIIQGASATAAEQILFLSVPLVKVYANESPIKLEVFRLNADNTQGSLVKSVSSQSCNGEELNVVLESGTYYLVKISGGVGRYKLNNSIGGDKRKLPSLVRDRAYEVLHPGEQVEQTLTSPFIYIFTGDISFNAINLKGDAHLELFDINGNLISQGITEGKNFNERLGLADIKQNSVYALQVSPIKDATETLISLIWGERGDKFTSANLILNPGAEDGPGSDSGGAVTHIPDWTVPSNDLAMPTVLLYSNTGNFPGPSNPGSKERGYQFFAGGPDNLQSGIEQKIIIGKDWYSAINQGYVKVELSVFLGGFDTQTDASIFTATLIDDNAKNLGSIKLGPIGPLERENKRGLLPVAASEFLPVGTTQIAVRLEFFRGVGTSNEGYADNLELKLSDYSENATHENPYPQIVNSGVYSREKRKLGTSSLCSDIAVATGTTIDLRDIGCNQIATTDPPPQRYSAQIQVENPSNEFLSFDWKLIVKENGKDRILKQLDNSKEMLFHMNDYGNTNLLTNSCTLTVKVNALEASRSKTITVWSGMCTYNSYRLN